MSEGTIAMPSSSTMYTRPSRTCFGCNSGGKSLHTVGMRPATGTMCGITRGNTPSSTCIWYPFFPPKSAERFAPATVFFVATVETLFPTGTFFASTGFAFGAGTAFFRGFDAAFFATVFLGGDFFLGVDFFPPAPRLRRAGAAGFLAFLTIMRRGTSSLPNTSTAAPITESDNGYTETCLQRSIHNRNRCDRLDCKQIAHAVNYFQQVMGIVIDKNCKYFK